MEGEPKNRESGLSETVGLNAENDEFAHADFIDEFEDQPMEEWEREKTPEEKEIIKVILAKLPEFIKQFGGKPLALTESHIHITDDEKVSQKFNNQCITRSGGYNIISQAVDIYPRDAKGQYNKLYIAQAITHELMHFLAFQSIQMHPEKDIAMERRQGFSVRKKGGTDFYFDKIDEALVQEASNMFEEKYFSEIPELADEIAKREEVKKIISANGSPESAKIVAYVQESDGNNFAMPYCYAQEMFELDQLVSHLHKANADKYSSEGNVKKVFFECLFTGRMLEIARMVKKFNPGDKKMFRKIGEITKRDRGK